MPPHHPLTLTVYRQLLSAGTDLSPDLTADALRRLLDEAVMELDISENNHLITVPQAQEILGLSRQGVYSLVAREQLSPLPDQRPLRFWELDVRARAEARATGRARTATRQPVTHTKPMVSMKTPSRAPGAEPRRSPPRGGGGSAQLAVRRTKGHWRRGCDRIAMPLHMHAEVVGPYPQADE